jgi:hypothetical protein
MRYQTVGDWVFVDDNNLQITVSDLGNRSCELLVTLHELIEAILCQDRGITGEVVDAYDRTFAGEGEPGDAGDCPYRSEHLLATSFEMQLAVALGVSWPEYEEKIEAKCGTENTP